MVLCAAAATLIMPSITRGAAAPVWFDPATMSGYKTDVADFYQHQFLAGNPGGVSGWEGLGGWCRPTALVDALYTYAVNGYPNLLPVGINQLNNWQNASGTAIAALRNVQGQGVNAFLASSGYGFAKGPGIGKGLVFNQFYVNQTSGAVTYVSASGARQNVPGTAFDLISRALLRNEDVMVRLGDTQPFNPPARTRFPNHWWAGPNLYGGNFHYVDAAGVDVANQRLYFADPDSNKGSGDANAGWNGTAKDARVAAIRYGAADPVPVAPRGANITDPPPNAENFYSNIAVDAAKGFQFMSADRYNGDKITMVETIAPVVAAKRARPQVAAARMVSPAADTVNTLDVQSELGDNVDKILFYPLADPISGGTDTLAGGGSFTEHNVAANAPDPLGDTHSFGGIEFDQSGSTGLGPGVMDTATLDTNGDFNAFDVLLHDSVTGQWSVEALNAPEDGFGDQQVPEPGALALLALAALAVRWSRRTAPGL